MKIITESIKYLALAMGLSFVGYLAFNFHNDIPLEKLKENLSYEDSKFIEVNGMDVHYRITGEGPALILLHGTGASLHTWEGWTNYLSEKFKIISVDLPGFGLTGKHIKNDYSINAYSDFLNTFLAKINIDSFHLAGNSLGGYIAWKFTVDHPEKVKRLILLDAAGYPHNSEEPPPLAFRLASNPVLNKFMLKITPKSLFRKSLEDVYANDDLVTEALIDRYFQLYLRSGNRQAFIDRVNQKQNDHSDLIATIQQPTLILWGDQDTWTPVPNAARFDNDIPDSELIMYKNVGHVPMEEIPEKSAKDAERFLLTIKLPNLVQE